MSVADHVRDAGSRVFTRWEFPLEAEPAHGFLLRLATAHYTDNVNDLCVLLGLNVDHLKPRECFDYITSSRCARAQDVASLDKWTPLRIGGHVRLAGEAVKHLDHSITTRRFCPGCIAESPHHRAWFDLLFMNRCPFHDLPITDRLHDGRRANWRWANISHGPDGASLAQSTDRIRHLPDNLETYVLGRLGLVPMRGKRFIDHFALHDVVEAVEILGRLAIGGWREDLPSLGSAGFEAPLVRSRGFPILAGGRETIAALFHRIAKKAPKGSFGCFVLFGWAFRHARIEFGMAAPLRRMMHEVAVELDLDQRRYERVGKEDRRLLTLREASQIVGATERAMIVEGHRLGALEQRPVGARRRPFLIRRERLAEIRDILDGNLTRAEAAAHIGVPAHVFARIVLGGHIAKVGRWSADDGSDRFLVAELNRFLESIPLVRRVEFPYKSHLPSVAWVLEQTHEDAGEFFDAVFAGQLVVQTRTDRQGGLVNFRIELRDQPFSHPFAARWRSLVISRRPDVPCGMMPQKSACLALEVDPPTIKLLFELGYLSRKKPKRGAKRNWHRIERVAVESFKQRYIAARVYAAAFNTNTTEVQRIAKARGLKSLFDSKNLKVGRLRISPIYDREQARAAFGFKHDPDTRDRARLGWKDMGEKLLAERSIFTLWSIDSQTEATFSTQDRAWSIKISYTQAEVPECMAGEERWAYAVHADLYLGGRSGSSRIDFFEECLEKRDIHPAIQASVDRAQGECRASIRSLFVVSLPVVLRFPR